MKGYNTTEDFIKALEAAGELIRVQKEVDPILEVSEIACRVMAMQGPALLFENVKGASMPLLINAYGSEKKMLMALGANSFNEISERMMDLLELKAPTSFKETMKMLPTIAGIRKFPPRTVKNAPCQEVTYTNNEIDLNLIPIIKCWPQDGGNFITLPQVITKSLKSGVQNVGMYRMQVIDKRTTFLHSQSHHGTAAHIREYNEAGITKIPCVVAIGGSSVSTYAATAPMPPELDEWILAGFLRNEPVDMVKAITCDLKVPAEADIILEGYIDTQDTRTEGPFGDHTGFYTLKDEYPTFHITTITTRKNPIYWTTIVGRPPKEDYFLGKATERIFLNILKKTVPEIVDMNLPVFGVFHNFCFVSIRKEYPYHARKVMNALWGLGQMSLTKYLVVVDSDIDVQNTNEVLFYVGANVDPQRDMQFTRGPIDVLDHASDIMGIGSKVGIDATRKWDGEGFKRLWPKDLKMDKEVVESVTSKWLEYGIPEKLMAGVEIVRGEKLLTELEARSGGGKIGNIESKEAQL
ncbi:MAG: menaquinone biosynthesis decarboxylase [Chlorobiota bacterium]|nr:menaquinone biosynthesis decarboxylase [Chlorobiota bacterium]QQS67390.1 MAG: menaquinone biosynthesis decarboxylase [Chlorobiota bacterium]